eukprot:13753022-Ditylum_brightwellii.AAC.1
MEAEMLLEMTIEAHRKKRFNVGCFVTDDNSLMRVALQQTIPEFVWSCVPPRGNGRLGAKLRDTEREECLNYHKGRLSPPEDLLGIYAEAESNDNLCGAKF